MATLREVKKSIRSVASTKRITGAMEMVAAAKLRRAQQRVEEARPFAEKMAQMLSHLASAAQGDIVHPYFEEREIKKRTLVVVVSDRGLCGSYNSNVIRRASKWLKKHSDVATEVVLVGKKAHDFFSRRDYQIVGTWRDWEGVLKYDKAKEIVKFLTDRFISGETDEITLMYTKFLSTVKYELTTETYLPIASPESGHDNEGESTVADYIFEPDAESIYSALMPGYATTRMVTALAESFASEHGSRMIAMNAATTNAGDMMKALTLEFNKARQAQITKELLEVVSGAEALNA